MGSDFDGLYKKLRVPKDENYYDKVPHDSNIDSITGVSNNLVGVKNDGGWHYRQPYSYSNHPRASFNSGDKDRISLAALANPNLIQELDKYVSSRRLSYYKTPQDSDSWRSRHDPITIYFLEPVTDEVRNEVKAIMSNKDYNRSMHIQNPLIGDEYYPGVAQDKSPSDDDIKTRIDSVKAMSANAAKALESRLIVKGRPKASAGQIVAVDEMLKLVKQGLEKKPLAGNTGNTGTGNTGNTGTGNTGNTGTGNTGNTGGTGNTGNTFRLSSIGIKPEEVEIKKFGDQWGFRNRKKGSPGYGRMFYYSGKANDWPQFLKDLKGGFGV